MNGNCEFKRNFKIVYPKHMEIYRENNSSSSALFAVEIIKDNGTGSTLVLLINQHWFEF